MVTVEYRFTIEFTDRFVLIAKMVVFYRVGLRSRVVCGGNFNNGVNGNKW